MTPPGHCSLVTWNILAPCWARQEKYPWAQPQQLAWGRRQQKIVDRLAELDPDIINLQEVEVARVASLRLEPTPASRLRAGRA